MGSYGLKLKDSGGSVILNYGDSITRLIYTNDVGPSDTGNITLSALNGLSSVEFAVSTDGHPFTPHKVYRSGNTIYWSPGAGPGNSRVVVFVYD